MRWIKKLSENIKRGIRSWLDIQEASPTNILINETLDYNANAIKNRIWYRGDSNELQQLYGQIDNGVDRYKFWASRCSPGMEMRKIHTGLPALIVDVLAAVTISDIKVKIEKKSAEQELWNAISKDNMFPKKLEKAVKETLYIGDGAFKISFNMNISKYPLLEFYPGDRIEIASERGRVREIVFRTIYQHDNHQYMLYEHYGHGYITYNLYRGNTLVPLGSIPQTGGLTDVAFGSSVPEESYMLAVPLQFYESGKWDERGQSIFDKKVDDFDAFDEIWSQWMDAVRLGKAKEYIPDNLIPRDPNGGELIKPNPFDNRFIKTEGSLGEGDQNKIDIEQPEIPHESFLASYVTALDLCLQGLISPSTLGIDVKKLDNAEAQREKEKTTLYTRDTIINAMQEDIPLLVNTAIKAYHEYNQEKVEDILVTVEFGDYANPSFESQVETIGKARSGQIMSVDAAVDTLYGDDKDDAWKAEEIQRIKSELGITEVNEPEIREDAGEFKIGGGQDEGQSGKQFIPDEQGKVQGTSKDSGGTGAVRDIRS